MKKLTAICISLILALASTAVCFADGLYEVDTQSGQIVGAEYGSDTEEFDYVRLSTTCAYDKLTKMYIYTNMGYSGTAFNSSVCNGMYTKEVVTLQADPTAMLRVYRNGEQLEFTGEGEFSEPGAYIVSDKANSQVLSFSILNNITCAIRSYEVPHIFFIEEVMLDGEKVSPAGNVVPMDVDGAYVIDYYCYDTGARYELRTTIDHTPPVLEISGVDEESYAHNAVTLGMRESYSTLAIKLDGKDINVTDTLTEPGVYNLVYTDQAGNSSSYDFTITPYLDISAWFAVAIIAVMILGTGAYMIYSRTHMRVR